jgi:predicted dehydrogenase
MIHRTLNLPRPHGPVPGIGVIGAGEIVEACHLPAYRAAGFPVVGLYDIDQQRAHVLGERFEIPVFDTLDALLDSASVGVVDIAVPVTAQDQIARRAMAAGHHLLCQKPLALDFGAALSLAEAARAAGIRAAVNHQMRYAPAIAAIRALVDDGAVGTPLEVRFGVNVVTPWERWPFWHSVPNFELFGHTIHYLDTLRALFGLPERVYAELAEAPGRDLPGPIRNHILLTYPGALRATIQVNHDAAADVSDWRADVRVEGTAGVLQGSNGALFDYPHGSPDTLSAFDRRHPEQGWQAYTLEGRWFPDAFAGTMGELLCAIEQDREPANSLADGIATIALVEAVARSANERRAVALDEITAVENVDG